MQLFELNNKELAAKYAAINSGKVIFLGYMDTKNPEIKTGFFGQLREDVSTSNVSTDEVLSLMLGFTTDNKRIVRATQSYKPSVMKLEEGQALPEAINIEVRDSLEAFYAGQEGRKRPDGSAILKDGKAVYRKEFLVAGAPKHQLITDYTHVQLPANTEAKAEAKMIIEA